MDIREALSQLDPLDDDQWTQDGAPKVESVAALLGDYSVKRQDIVNAAPAFSRSNPVTEIEPKDDATVSSNEEETNGQEEEGPEEVIPDEMLETSNPNEFVAWLKEQPKENLESIAREIELSADAIDSKIRKARAKEYQLRGFARIVRQAHEAAYPNTSNQEAIVAYIAAQNKARAERAARRNDALKHITRQDLDPRSPLDQAMARNTKRGTQRPKR